MPAAYRHRQWHPDREHRRAGRGARRPEAPESGRRGRPRRAGDGGAEKEMRAVIRCLAIWFFAVALFAIPLRDAHAQVRRATGGSGYVTPTDDGGACASMKPFQTKISVELVEAD